MIPTDPGAQRPSGLQSPRWRVLMIQQHDRNTFHLTTLLVGEAGKDFSLLPLKDPNQVAEYLRERTVDAILLDLSSTDEPALAAFTKVSVHAPDIPIIALGMSEQEDLLIRTVHQGAQDYLLLDQLHPTTVARTIRHAIEHNLSERARRESESYYRSLFQGSIDPILITSMGGQILDANPAFVQHSGYTEDELLKLPLEELYVDLEDRRRFIQQIGVAGLVQDFEARFRRKDGTVVDCLLAATLRRDAEGTPIGIQTIVRDVTPGKRLERELVEALAREQEARTAAEEARDEATTILESITDAFLSLDREWRFTYINEEARRFAREHLRGDPETFLDRVLWEVVPELTGTRFEDEYRRVMAGGGASHFEEFHSRWGIWFESHVYPARDGISIYFRDITQRKQAEEERRGSEAREQLMRALELERSRLSALFEQAPAFIAILEGPEHVFQITNPQYDQLIGQRDVLGNPIREALPEVEGQGHFELLDQVYQTGEPYVGRASPLLLQRGEGAELEEHYLNFVYQPFLGPEGIVSGVFVHGVDVTDLVRTRQVAEAANQAKSEFLSRMSHELRTPLNAILGFSQILELDLETEENQESVDHILRAGKHLLSLIDEVLDIARVEAGRMHLSVEPISVRSVLQESVDLVRLTASKKGIALQAQDALASEYFVQADQQRLKQVLLNLLSNGIKYNRRGGTVTLSCEEAGENHLCIAVRDTGYGIPVEKLARLFTPFDRLGADQTGVEGTGLGLALSKGLVEAMGGRLGVESVEGEGSRFWVELPLAPRPAVAEPAPEKMRVEISRDAAVADHTVLFVEDNLANVRLMERIFQRRPQVRLLTAMQGSLGLELAREHRPDLVLLDLNLPDLSGDKVLLQIRQDPALQNIRVVMISGEAIPSQVQRMLDIGAQGYLTKPFDIQELLRLVDERLQREER